MRGQLSDTSVADLCRRLADAGATGTLEVNHPSGTGRLALVDGRLVWAEPPTTHARLGDRLVHAGLLERGHLEEALAAQADDPRSRRLGALLVEQGRVSRDTIRVYVQEQILDTLVELSFRSEGTYVFAAWEAPEEDLPADLRVGDALAVVARRQEEWERIRETIPDPEAVPRQADPAAVDADHLEPDDLAILGVIDGRRSIRQLAATLGYGTYEAARLVYGLVLQGLVDVEAGQPSAPRAELDDAEFATLLDDLAADESPEPAVERDAAPEPTPEEPESPPAQPAEAAQPAPEPPLPRSRNGDVSEFLRELSQLASDEDRDR